MVAEHSLVPSPSLTRIKRFYTTEQTVLAVDLEERFLGVWAFLESLAWFVAVDYALFFMGLKEPDRWKHWLAVTAAGSAIGIITHYLLVLSYPSSMQSMLLSTPFVQSSMVDAAQSNLASLHMVFLQAYTFIPVKVWTFLVPNTPISFPLFFIVVMSGRLTRWLLVIGVVKGLNTIDNRFNEEWYPLVSFVWTVFFFGLILFLET